MGGGKKNKQKDKKAKAKSKPEECFAVEVVHYIWTGKELTEAQPGGVGIIPIEDQFKAISTNDDGEVYESFKFLSAPERKLGDGVVFVFGPGLDGVEQVITLAMPADGAIIQACYDCYTVIWVNQEWIVGI